MIFFFFFLYFIYNGEQSFNLYIRYCIYRLGISQKVHNPTQRLFGLSVVSCLVDDEADVVPESRDSSTPSDSSSKVLKHCQKAVFVFFILLSVGVVLPGLVYDIDIVDLSIILSSKTDCSIRILNCHF